jgi:chromatin remodeling complex protein RSC6
MNYESYDDNGVLKNFFISVDPNDDNSNSDSSCVNKPCKLENVLSQISTIHDGLTLFKMNINSLQQQLKVLEKDVKKEMRQIQKQKQKQNEEEIIKSKRKPSGFAKPGNVTIELCKFMECDEGTKLARTQVTQYLFKYIKDNNLTQSYSEFNEETRKNQKKTKIILDDKLQKLLGLKDKNSEITHFSIQKYMNKHFL